MDDFDDLIDSFELDSELGPLFEEELIKWAEEEGIDLQNPYGGEGEMIQSWQQNPTPEGFAQLYNLHGGLINRASSGYMKSNLPKAAMKGYAMQRYTHALQTFDPNKGRAFSSHVFQEMQRLGRYSAKYSNVARIGSEDLTRGGMINLLQDTLNALKDKLGRIPTDSELADEMLQSTEDVASMQKMRDKINIKNVGNLRSRLREDTTLEGSSMSGPPELEGVSKMGRQAAFLHGSLNPEQQLVLEHTIEGFGKPLIPDNEELAGKLGLSPQKVRALKAQILKRIERTY